MPISGDAPVPDADVRLDDAGMIDDERVGNDGVDRAIGPADLALAHAVADHLAAAELHLLAIDGEVLLYLHDQFGIGEADLVTNGRAEHVGIGGAGNASGHLGWLRYMLLPSNFCEGGSLSTSTLSRQRALMAIIGVPSGIWPREKLWMPQVEQKR